MRPMVLRDLENRLISMLTAVLSMNPSRLEQARPEDFFPVKTIYRFAFFRSINLPFAINSCCKKKKKK